MGNVLSKNVKNNLEQYLNDVYTQECLFVINHEEVNFIQTGIENLVQKLVNFLHDGDFCLDNGPQQEGRSLLEVYFPIKMENNLDNHFYGTIPYTKRSIIKVGSFYEGAKNKYPNEFDFIFLLYCIERMPTFRPDYDFFSIFHEITKKYGTDLQFPSVKTSDQDRTLKFLEVSKRRGPATKLKFHYLNNSKIEEIHVDLVAAIKVTSRSGILRKNVKEWCSLAPFRKRICATGSVLIPIDRQLFAFTETEVHFMRNILSSNHVKVYQILKFIFNGNGHEPNYDDDIYFYADCIHKFRITSYFIKVTMIYHHYECTNSDPSDIGPCMIQVLDKMSNSEVAPTLQGKYTLYGHRISHIKSYMDRFFSITPLIQCLSDYFKSLQSSKFDYSYETFKITQSLSQTFVEVHLQKPDQIGLPDKEIIWPVNGFTIQKCF